MLEVKNISKNYNGKKVLDNISFTAEPGDIVGIVGHNGAGKSTLLSIIAGISKASEGKVVFNGQSKASGYRRQTGYVPQEIALFETITGYDNLKFFARAYNVPEKKVKERIREVCEIVSFDEADLKKKVKSYSGGMKRKINIAASVMHEPELIILDEPTANIDFMSEEQIVKAIKRFGEKGATVLYVGHQMDITEKLCDKVCVLKEGQQKYFGAAQKLKDMLVSM